MSGRISYSFRFPGGVAEDGTVVRFCPSLNGGFPHLLAYSLADIGLVRPIGRVLSPEIADLIDILVAIAICDRRAPRLGNGVAELQDVTRSIQVLIPVRRPDLWGNPSVIESILNLAKVLTSDEWLISYEARYRDPRRSEIQLSLDLNRPSSDTIVALNSGGLDSLLGLAGVLAGNDAARIIPVSALTHRRTQQVVEQVTRSLTESFPKAQIASASLGLTQFRSHLGIDDRSSEYRTRILVCLAARIAVAAALGTNCLQLTENGPGAINLPICREQIDSWTTRATHPKTLDMASQLVSEALGRPFLIKNTGQWSTKGQLAILLRDDRFVEAARQTVSCIRFPYLSVDEPCGTCTSCLYRQIALHAASKPSLDDGRFLTRARPRSTNPDLNVARHGLKSHASHLRTLLSSADPYTALDAEFRRIDEALEVGDYLGMTDDEIKLGIVAMYRAFADEVESYLAQPIQFNELQCSRPLVA